MPASSKNERVESFDDFGAPVSDFDDHITPLIPDGQVPMAIAGRRALDAMRRWQNNVKVADGLVACLRLSEGLSHNPPAPSPERAALFDATILDANAMIPLLRLCRYLHNTMTIGDTDAATGVISRRWQELPKEWRQLVDEE